MKLFECQACGQALYFENTVCEKCHRRLGYVPDGSGLLAFEQTSDHGVWQVAGGNRALYRFCRNAASDACNWVVEADAGDVFCAACRHNHLIPDLSSGENLKRWRLMEQAKHRLFYTLIQFKLPLITRGEDPREGLAFDFLEDTAANQAVLTGHNDGMITINIAEADDAEREKRRAGMREPYRTLLGHFRHEVGHWYWDRLVRDTPALAAFRTLFGDEREDYEAALRRHYANGAPNGWRDRFVSAYATSHPWEDWAETFAHYLHIVDTLETAREFGITVHPRYLTDPASLSTNNDVTPRLATSIAPLIDAWLPLTFAVNSLNRSMGQADLYPFVLSPKVVEKLGFVHALVRGDPVSAPKPVPISDGIRRPPLDNVG